MDIFYLLPGFLPIIIFLLFSKKISTYFFKGVAFNSKLIFVLILYIVLFYLLTFSFILGIADGSTENGVQCYAVIVHSYSIAPATPICSTMLNNIPQINFIIFSIIILSLIIIISYLIFKRDVNLKNILLKEIDLPKEEEKIRGSFLITALIITVIIIVYGYIFFNNLIK